MDNFHFIMPATISKSKGGEWRIKGLASTEAVDKQGERIVQKGMNLAPIAEKKGIINWDHKTGPENLIGFLDGYTHDANGLMVEGRLFQNHARAKAVYEIMSSLTNSDVGKMGLSVEGQVLERDPKDSRIITKCQINGVAVTLNPVNADTYADLIKSMTGATLDFESMEGGSDPTKLLPEPKLFSATEVVDLLTKALGVGGEAASQVPAERSGGSALALEDLDEKPKVLSQPKKPKKLKKMSSQMYKSGMDEILSKIQTLYPEYSRVQLWDALKDRLTKKFPSVID